MLAEIFILRAKKREKTSASMLVVFRTGLVIQAASASTLKGRIKVETDTRLIKFDRKTTTIARQKLRQNI